MSTADAILDQIDRVLADGVSDDAMRWTPDVVDVEDLGPYGLWEIGDGDHPVVSVAINVEDLVDLPSRLRSIAKAYGEVAVRITASLSEQMSVLSRLLVAPEPPPSHREMHAAYRHRQTARRRRRRT